jgi:hypothetical protein
MTTQAGIAVASGCGPCCAAEVPSATEYAPGRRMGIICAADAAELVAAGWVLTENPHEPPDVACPHYGQLCAEG